MKSSTLHPGNRLLGAVTAATVALALYGCGDEPAPKPAVTATPPAAPAPQAVPAPAPEKPAATSQSDADQALAARVKSALTAAPDINAHRIDVTAKSGAVTLFGTADTKEQREAAGKAATAVAGVTSVENKLAVVAGS